MSIEFDFSETRSDTIAMNGLSRVDAVYSFFYDETNNIRKLRINNGKFNTSDTHNFVLGGVVREETPSKHDAELLIQSLLLQKTTAELKTKHIGTGDFHNLIKSSKLKLIFEWIQENNYLIHFVNLNIVYWSVVDIIDSIIMSIGSPEMIAINASLKSDLYEIIKSDEERWLNFLSQYNYPNVGEDSIKPFIRTLVEMVRNQVGETPSFRHKVLLDFFQTDNITELVFLSGEKNGELIENFAAFYKQPIWLFKNSNHIFDNESTIEAILNKEKLTYQGETIQNYKFCDSKNEPLIQISDVISGVLGKLFSFVKDSKMNEIIEFKSLLDGTAAENMFLLTSIMQKTLACSYGFHLHIISEGEHKRLEKLLYTA